MDSWCSSGGGKQRQFGVMRVGSNQNWRHKAMNTWGSQRQCQGQQTGKYDVEFYAVCVAGMKL